MGGGEKQARKAEVQTSRTRRPRHGGDCSGGRQPRVILQVTEQSWPDSGDHPERRRNSGPLCCEPAASIVLFASYASETNKLIERRVRLVVTRGGGKGELGEGGQKLQNSRYREVRFKMINITNTVVHLKVVKGKSWVLMIRKKHVFVFL